MGWNVFAAMVMERFMEEEGENLVGDFKKLQQEGSVEDYRSRLKNSKLSCYKEKELYLRITLSEVCLVG